MVRDADIFVTVNLEKVATFGVNDQTSCPALFGMWV